MSLCVSASQFEFSKVFFELFLIDLNQSDESNSDEAAVKPYVDVQRTHYIGAGDTTLHDTLHIDTNTNELQCF